MRNARTGQGIANASVSVGSAGAAPTATTTTDGNGGFSFANLNAGTYELRGSGSGYTPSTRIGVAVGNNSITSGQDLVLSPIGANEIRIVLTWGASPTDLDAHLTGPNPGGSRFHVYWASAGSLTSAPFASLENDEVDGFGPETITITQMNAGTYRYSVHDYSNRNSTTATGLGQSGATVQVYTSAGLVQTFSVPNQAGTLWTVFEITGTLTSPVITPVNTMGFASNPGGITAPPAASRIATDAELIGRAARQHPKVRRPQ